MSESRALGLDNNHWTSRPSNTLISSHTPYHNSVARYESVTAGPRLESNRSQYRTDSQNMSSSLLSRIPSFESRVEDLRKKIHQSHLSYLNMEDTPEKLELKSKLEGLIFDFLSLVPHSRKFSCLDVANCFNQTIIDKGRDFSALDASISFEKLEKYATNILRHPWRKEFNVIYSYGGSFRHHVSKNIVGSVNILHAMGYHEKKDATGNTPAGQFVLEEVIDPDKLTKVALGCLVAFVECQVMLQIQSLLKTKSNLNVSFDDIFSVRLRFIGGMDLAVRLLTEANGNASSIPSSFSSSSYSSSHHNPYHLTSSLPSNHLPPVVSKSNALSSRNRYIPSSQSSFDSVSVLNGHQRSVSSTNSSFDLLDYPSRSRAVSNDVVLAPLGQQLPSPSYSSQGHNSFAYEAMNSVQSPVPPPAMFANDSPSKSMASTASNHRILDTGMNPSSSSSRHIVYERNVSLPRSESESSSLRPAEYLPSITSKSRNLLGANQSHFQAPPVPPPPLMTYDREDAILRSNAGSTRVSSRPSSLDESEERRMTDNPLPVPPRTRVSTISFQPWSCSFCTYVNRYSREVCEVCFKSRERGADASPLVSGGKECSVCTLVNSREATRCKACSADLFEAPTYI